MLFEQLQTRRRRSTILGIDSLLNEFESINQNCGQVRGFAMNALSCVDFVSVLESLAYETSPPKDFGFAKKKIFILRHRVHLVLGVASQFPCKI